MRDFARIVRRERVVGETDEREDLVGTRHLDGLAVGPLDDDVVGATDHVERNGSRTTDLPLRGLECGTDLVGHIRHKLYGAQERCIPQRGRVVVA